jgi:hypothetical protein
MALEFLQSAAPLDPPWSPFAAKGFAGAKPQRLDFLPERAFHAPYRGKQRRR